MRQLHSCTQGKIVWGSLRNYLKWLKENTFWKEPYITKYASILNFVISNSESMMWSFKIVPGSTIDKKRLSFSINEFWVMQLIIKKYIHIKVGTYMPYLKFNDLLLFALYAPTHFFRLVRNIIQYEKKWTWRFLLLNSYVSQVLLSFRRLILYVPPQSIKSIFAYLKINAFLLFSGKCFNL